MRSPAAPLSATQSKGHSPAPELQPIARPAGLENLRPEAVAQRKLAEFIRTSPRMVAQAKRDAALCGEPVQCAGPEDEEMLQGKSAPAQLAGPEEEEMLQGKFAPVQCAGPEDEEMLQGKSAPAQLAGPEEEETLQGKFAPVQLAGPEEEEMLQGKSAPAQLSAGAPEEEELLQGKFAPVQLAGPEEEEMLQGKSAPAQLSAGAPEEEELLQGKFAPVQRAESASQSEPRENKTGLPDDLKAGVESLSGMSLDHVQVHYNSAEPAQLNALAYAQGSDIHVAPGQEQHLPHEAWHVVQQAQGRVKPTMQMKDGVPVNDDAGLEHEADMMGAQALAAHPGSGPKQERQTMALKELPAGAPPMQLMKILSASSSGSETVVFEYHERQPDSSGMLGTDGYFYTSLGLTSGGQSRYERKKIRFKGYGTFTAPEPVLPQSFSGTESKALSGLEHERRIGKVAEAAEKNPMSRDTYEQLTPSRMKETYAQSESLMEDSDSLKRHRVLGLGKSTGGFVVGKIADSASGLPLKGAFDTLSTAKDAMELAPSMSRDGYEPIPGSKSVTEAKSVLASFLGKKSVSKGASVGGGVGGAAIGGMVGSVVPVLGTVVGGVIGGAIGSKAASKAVDKATSADDQGDDVRLAIQILHTEARKGDGEAFEALLGLGLSEDVVRASDGWKAAVAALNL